MPTGLMSVQTSAGVPASLILRGRGGEGSSLTDLGGGDSSLTDLGCGGGGVLSKLEQTVLRHLVSSLPAGRISQAFHL